MDKSPRAFDLEIGEIGLPELVRSHRPFPERVCRQHDDMDQLVIRSWDLRMRQEGGSGHAEPAQHAIGRQAGKLDQPNDHPCLGRSISHLSLPPSASMLFSAAESPRLLRDDFLQVPGSPTQVLDLGRGRRARGVAHQAFLPGLQALFRLAVVQALGDTFPSTQVGYAVFPYQIAQQDPYLLFR